MLERKFKALLIANWQYPNDPSNLPTLYGPRFDAEFMQAALTDSRTGLHRNEDVTILTNSDKQELLLTLEGFYLEAHREDQLLLYFSGHGQLDLSGRLYLCASNSRLSRLRATAIAAHEISDMMDESRAKAKVVILDCCHSGGFKGRPDLPANLAGKGRFILSSSSLSQRTKDAVEEDGGASPFTSYVVEALTTSDLDNDGDGFISLDELYGFVATKMTQAGLSTPQRQFDDAVSSVAIARSSGAPRHHALPSVHQSAPVVMDYQAAVEGFLQADGLEQAKNLRAARSLYRQVAASGNGDWSTLAALRQARLANGGGRLDEAEMACRVVIESQHREWSQEARYLLGSILMRLNKRDEAIEEYAEIAETGHLPWSPLASFELAHLLQPGDSSELRSFVQYHLEQASHSPDPALAAKAEYELGIIDEAGEQWTSAASHYQRALDLPDTEWSSSAALRLGHIYEEQRQLDRS